MSLIEIFFFVRKCSLLLFVGLYIYFSMDSVLFFIINQ